MTTHKTNKQMKQKQAGKMAKHIHTNT